MAADGKADPPSPANGRHGRPMFFVRRDRDPAAHYIRSIRNRNRSGLPRGIAHATADSPSTSGSPRHHPRVLHRRDRFIQERHHALPERDGAGSGRGGKRSHPLLLEDLEGRVVLSLLMPIKSTIRTRSRPIRRTPSIGHRRLWTSARPSPVGYTPAQIRAAYGINNIIFGAVTGDGTGQTIAIVNAYDDPAFVDSTDPNFSTSDLAAVRPGVRPARPAELHQVQRGRPDDEPARHRPGRRRQPQRQLGDGGGARHRVGARHRPRGEHRPGRGEQRHQQHRHVHRGGHRRRPARASRSSR